MSGGDIFDEMTRGDASPRAVYARIQQWLNETPPDVLASRRSQAELMFRRIGITFAVYGQKNATERLIPFDIIPRVLSRSEWTKLEAGLVQRVKALNMFLADIYNRRDILRADVMPEVPPLAEADWRGAAWLTRDDPARPPPHRLRALCQ